ncbi:hypothetical protein [Nocardia nova]|uniref:hypothetical protein n=1 Tax=Nocardia nova TaxID=37330 RepID=UPI0011DD8641|nr:hypothetical protein [Nocardia nova]
MNVWDVPVNGDGELGLLDIHVVAPLQVDTARLAGLVPEVFVDGIPIATGWGHWAVPVPAGRRDVAIHVNRFGALLHPARLTVDVPAGGRTPVHYRMPVGAFASARIGTGPQGAGGGASAIAAMLLMLLVVVPLGLVMMLFLFVLLA